jgi:putative flippase GtrA
LTLLRSRPVRYLFVGLGNTLLGYGAYSLSLIYGMSVPVASLVAIIVGLAISFFSQGLVVFGNVTMGALFRFVGSWMVMYAVYVGAVTALQFVGVSPYIGGLAAAIPTSIVSYFVLRSFVFSSPS